MRDAPTRGMVGLLAVAVFPALVVAAHGSSERGQAPSDRDASAYQAVVEQYCVTCHNERLRTGNLALDGARLSRVADDADVWEKVLRKLETQTMPPPRRPRPDATTYTEFASWLEMKLDAAAAVDPNPGRPTLHRLNRFEYANAIRDLLALEIDSEALLPGDDMAYGFDNNADILTVAPGQLERYISAARKVSRLAIGDPSIEADVARYPLSSLLVQNERMSEELPFGSRGGTAISHHFPLDGEYVIRIQLQQNSGRRESQEIDVRIDGARVALLPVGRWPEGHENAERAETAGSSLTVRVPARAGTRMVSVSFAEHTMVTEGVGPRHLPVWTFATGRGFVERMALESVEIEGPYNPDSLGPGPDGESEKASRRRIFVCSPSRQPDQRLGRTEEACATEILTTLARRAFRRPVASGDIDIEVLLDFFRAGRAEGGFDRGIQRALENILVDPEFLFRLERDPPDVPPTTAYALSDIELASRLSFFLWSSGPDDELLEVAAEGRLSDPLVWEQQVRRLLADTRASSLVTSFAAQWLHLRRMRSVTPDVNAFPAFDDNLRDALVRETELFVESQIQGDRSVVDLLTADYTFVNERLARHYRIPRVYGSRFRRVTLDDPRRRGLLGHGSILTVTSLATRTSPVVRGKWVLENIFGTPPPPPPPDVPALPESNRDTTPQSLRERLELHRASPVCASCHVRMDPLGFGLQNFDAVGQWRERGDAGTVIDSSGVLPDGTAFDGPVELRQVLLTRRSEFVRTVTEKLLTYALGRGIEYYDRPAIRAIVRDAERDDYRWSSLILAVTRSMPFQMRRSEP